MPAEDDVIDPVEACEKHVRFDARSVTGRECCELQDGILAGCPDDAVCAFAALAVKLERAERENERLILGRDGPWTPTHRHRKGGAYRVLMRAQRTDKSIFADDGQTVVYDDIDGTVWVRSAAEFDDGRFTALSPAPSKER